MSKFIDEEHEDYSQIGGTPEEYDEYAWATQLKHQLEKAVEVWIASAFVDMRAVDMLISTIKALPEGQSREIRIILDKKFHESPLAREAIINRLYSIPNVDIRLAETKGKFHPKCYVFNHGSTTGCLVGSMNLTDSAMQRNIEFGIFSERPEDIKKCRKFFLHHWRSAEKAPLTDRMDFPIQKFRRGDTVRHIASQKIGCVHEIDNSQEPIRYNIFFGTTSNWHKEKELESAHTGIIPLPGSTNIKKIFQSNDEFRKFCFNYLNRRYLAPAETGLYTLLTSRIHEYWYQQIPLMKILSLLRPRLLIADEVGLGKTIEAGLILRELITRMPLCRRILIICPNNLIPKWELEMRCRFGLFFTTYKGKQVDDFTKFLEKGSKTQAFNALISYQALQQEKYIKRFKRMRTSIDIIVCDEAHHLRNPTKQQAAVRALSQNVRCFLMLTATPINLSNKDLRILLGILDPEEYSRLDLTKWPTLIRPNLYISRLYSAISDCIERAENKTVVLDKNVLQECQYLYKSVLNTKLYGARFPADHPLTKTAQELVSLFEKDKVRLDISEASGLANRVVSANTLAKNITKTRKEDAGEFNQRKVNSIKVTLVHEEEKNLFDAYLKLAKKTNKQKASKLVAYSILRRASSCLPVVDDLFLDEEDDESETNGTIAEQNWQPSSAQLDFQDSKYAKLKEIISNVAAKDSDYRILIFAVFKRTIKYLRARIERDFGEETAAVVHGSVPMEDRYKAYNDFAKAGRPHVLICSEVASEGVDLQCCNILINYDLPWNPTVVEQRIGRIDRHGQQADKVYIFNIVVERTVEEIIYSRLDHRLTETRNTLGPVPEILGNLESELPKRILSSRFSSSERERYLRQLNTNLIAAKKKENNLSKETIRLIGSREMYKRSIEQRKAQYIDNACLVGRYVINCHRELFSLQKHNDIDILEFKQSKVKWLLKEFRRYLLNDGRLEQAKHLLPILAENKMEVVFSRTSALKSYAEYLSIDHPLVRFLLNRQKSPNQLAGLYSMETKSSEVPEGKYLIFEYSSESSLGPVKYDYLFHQTAFLIKSNKLEKVENSKIMARLFDFSSWNRKRSLGLPKKLIKAAEEQARHDAEESFAKEHGKIASRLQTELDLKKRTIDQIYFKEKQQLTEKIQRTVDPNKRKKFQDEFYNIENEIERRKNEILSSKDLQFSPKSILISTMVRGTE